MSPSPTRSLPCTMYAAGIDVGNESHYVAVPPGRDARPVREFGSWTAALEEMAEWLKTCGIETVVNVMTIQTVLGEVGPDLSAWKSEDQWSSWLNLAAKRDISEGRVIRHRREYRTNRAGHAFCMAAESLVRSESYLGARYQYLRAKLGGPKAVKAMARVLACLYYRLVTKGQVWVDRGTAEFNHRRQQRDLASLLPKARSLGMQLVPTT